MIPMTLHSTPYLFWKARYGTCRVFSIWAMPMIQSTYCISSERSFQLEYSTVKILGIGPVVRDIQELSWAGLLAGSGRLHLISFISSLPPHGTPSILISTESYFQGESNHSCITA